jgi:hypothetical protein
MSCIVLITFKALHHLFRVSPKMQLIAFSVCVFCCMLLGLFWYMPFLRSTHTKKVRGSGLPESLQNDPVSKKFIQHICYCLGYMSSLQEALLWSCSKVQNIIISSIDMLHHWLFLHKIMVPQFCNMILYTRCLSFGDAGVFLGIHEDFMFKLDYSENVHTHWSGTRLYPQRMSYSVFRSCCIWTI